MGISKGIFVGQVQRKVGKVVFRMRDGVNVVSQKPASVSNPRTEGQMIQRMVFTTCFGAYKSVKEIANHSWEGKKYGTQSMSYFMKNALNDLRANATKLDSIHCCQKGNANVLVAGGMKISEGSLQSIGEVFCGSQNTNESPVIKLADTVKIGELKQKYGIQPGDQLTFGLLKSGGQFAADSLHQPKYTRMYLSRLVIKANVTDDKPVFLFSQTTHKGSFNSDIVDDLKSSNLDALVFTENTDSKKISWLSKEGLNVDADWYQVGAFCILSRKVNTTWQRSTEYIIGLSNNAHWILDGSSVLPTYNPKSSYYLNNAAK